MKIEEKISSYTELLCFAVHAWERKEISDDEFSLYDLYVTDQILKLFEEEKREIFREIEEEYTQTGFAADKREYRTIIMLEQKWQALKSRFLKGK